jgi:hypothetical protein
VDPEWIGFAGAVVAAVLAGFFALRQTSLNRRREAEQVLTGYR